MKRILLTLTCLIVSTGAFALDINTTKDEVSFTRVRATGRHFNITFENRTATRVVTDCVRYGDKQYFGRDSSCGYDYTTEYRCEKRESCQDEIIPGCRPGGWDDGHDNDHRIPTGPGSGDSRDPRPGGHGPHGPRDPRDPRDPRPDGDFGIIRNGDSCVRRLCQQYDDCRDYPTTITRECTYTERVCVEEASRNVVDKFDAHVNILIGITGKLRGSEKQTIRVRYNNGNPKVEITAGAQNHRVIYNYNKIKKGKNYDVKISR